MTSENSNYPDFYRPIGRGSALEVAQLQEATKTFNSLFDDLMLEHMADIKRLETIKDRPTADLSKRIVVGEQHFTLSVEDMSTGDEHPSSFDFRDSEIIKRSITVQRLDGQYGREFWSYRLSADNVVRRFDGGDVFAKVRQEHEMGIGVSTLHGDETGEEMARIALGNLQDLTSNAIPNARLEENMGLNMQPVAPEELEGLRGFLGDATFSNHDY